MDDDEAPPRGDRASCLSQLLPSRSSTSACRPDLTGTSALAPEQLRQLALVPMLMSLSAPPGDDAVCVSELPSASGRLTGARWNGSWQLTPIRARHCIVPAVLYAFTLTLVLRHNLTRSAESTFAVLRTVVPTLVLMTLGHYDLWISVNLYFQNFLLNS